MSLAETVRQAIHHALDIALAHSGPGVAPIYSVFDWTTHHAKMQKLAFHRPS